MKITMFTFFILKIIYFNVNMIKIINKRYVRKKFLTEQNFVITCGKPKYFVFLKFG